MYASSMHGGGKNMNNKEKIKKWIKLSPKHDSSKSFYGKAQVKVGNGVTLKSYDTEVAKIVNGKAIVKGLYSQTTTKHIKDFLKQHGIKVESSKQIMQDFGGDF